MKIKKPPRKNKRNEPTVHDVAKAAGVTIGTVSKALNNSGSLKDTTREHIIKVAKDIGFRPNDLALALHRGKSFTVGLISSDNFGRFTMPILEGLESRLSQDKIAVFMSNATDDPEREKQHIDQLLRKRVDGLIITSRRSDHRPSIDIGNIDIPIIYVFSQSDDPDELSLLPDDFGGAKLAVQHLVDLGRKNIAHITGPESFEAVELRKQGYLSVLKTAKLDHKPEYFVSTKWSEKAGRNAARKLFFEQNSTLKSTYPDALFCGNDQLARGAADTLREIGLKVPEDVAIVGFDNWEVMTDAATPPLTSVDMNLKELGIIAGEKIIQLINGKEITGVKRLPCTLVLRDSCGAKNSKNLG